VSNDNRVDSVEKNNDVVTENDNSNNNNSGNVNSNKSEPIIKNPIEHNRKPLRIDWIIYIIDWIININNQFTVTYKNDNN